MIDLHTHILCGMDDGARNADMSLEMLRMERQQGVDTVVLTPHFYRNREHSTDFLRRRREAAMRLRERLEQLPEEEQAALPRMIAGAEVAWVPNLRDCDHLDQMCLGKTKYLLLELPYSKWDSALVDQIYDLMSRTGLTPVLAHLDRYRRLQRPEQLREMMELDVPVQLSASEFLRLTGRGYNLKALRQYAHVVASDCHDPIRRRPDLGEAMAVIEKKLGRHAVLAIDKNARELVGL